MMPRTSSPTLATLATAAALVAAPALSTGCSSTADAPPPTVVAFSDIHFDPFFDPSLLPELESSPESEWAAIFAKAGTSPGDYGGTTNAVLLHRAFTSIRTQQPRPALAVFAGDLLVQGYPDLYYIHTRTRDEAAMRAFALKAVTYVVHQIREGLGSTPAYFTLGNWDNYAKSFGLVPNDPFLADTANLFFDGLLARSTDRAGFDATYRTGGYYAAEVPGSSLVVIGLNDLFLTPDLPADVQAAATQELAWLDSTLASIQASGRRAWIVTHVPLGIDLVTTSSDLDPQGRITKVTSLLVPAFQEQLLSILVAHHEVLAGVFTGHTHMDEYRVATVAMQGIPGITSDMGNAPAYKSFTVSSGWELLDYVSWTIDLSVPTATFQPWYDFSSAYALPAPLEPAQLALVPLLTPAGTPQDGYRARYGSGHPPNAPITDLNWPVYRCGISYVGVDGLTGCVNGP